MKESLLSNRFPLPCARCGAIFSQIFNHFSSTSTKQGGVGRSWPLPHHTRVRMACTILLPLVVIPNLWKCPDFQIAVPHADVLLWPSPFLHLRVPATHRRGPAVPLWAQRGGAVGAAAVPCRVPPPNAADHVGQHQRLERCPGGPPHHVHHRFAMPDLSVCDNPDRYCNSTSNGFRAKWSK